MPYRSHEDITWKPIKNGVVVLNLASGAFFTLNDTAALIWQSLMAKKTADEVIDEIKTLYKVQRAVVARDVNMQIDMLVQENLIQKI